MSSNIGVSVDIGSKETKITVRGPASAVHSRSLPIADRSIDEAVARHLERKYNLLIGRRTAGALKRELGARASPKVQPAVEVWGRRSTDNALEKVFVSGEDMDEALAEVIHAIAEAVTAAVTNIPAEISEAVRARGIVLRGGSDLPRRIDQALTNATGMAVRRA